MAGERWTKFEDVEHGTAKGYRWEKSHSVEPCELCTKAQRAEWAIQKGRTPGGSEPSTRAAGTPVKPAEMATRHKAEIDAVVKRHAEALAKLRAKHREEAAEWRKTQRQRSRLPQFIARRRRLVADLTDLSKTIAELNGGVPIPLGTVIDETARPAVAATPRSPLHAETAKLPVLERSPVTLQPLAAAEPVAQRVERLPDPDYSGPTIRCPRCKEQIPVSKEEIESPAKRTDVMEEHMRLDCAKRPGARHAAAITR